jgi:quinoprotein glucose dehydrogenase
LWDYDPASAPNLVTIRDGGRAIDAVVQLTKQGFAFVFDRVTGRPLWPIEERPVPASDVAGERAWPTQPFPTRPVAFSPQGAPASDLFDYTPALKAAAEAELAKYTGGPLYTPPSGRGTIMRPGIIGGANWGGAAFDPATGMFYVPSFTNPIVSRLVPQPIELGNLPYLAQGVVQLPLVDGLPVVKPPYSRVTAYDLNQGTIVWQVPIGDGPRNHPLLAALNTGPLGVGSRGSALVTATLLFVSQTAGRRFSDTIPREPATLRALDKATGEVLWKQDLSLSPTASPMTYQHRGTQYVVIATGGGLEAELVAFALPDRISP